MQKRKVMPAAPDRLRVPSTGRPIGVDRQAKIIRGYVVALAGPFKSEGRGEFDVKSLEALRDLWPAAGLKSRFAHPNESSDGLGKFLGRARAPSIGTAVVERGGKQVEVPALRADLHLDQSAFDGNPNGNLGNYVMSLAESDPAALSSSLVLRKKSEYRIKPDGTPELDAEGNELPPLWRPTQLFASDVVDTGDAVDGILSAGAADPQWTREYIEQGEQLITKLFVGQPRRVVQARLMSYLTRYLGRRYGELTVSNKSCGRCGKNEGLGANLGGLLDGLIEGAVTDERTRDVILNELAESASISVEDVNAIVDGTSDCPALATLQAFAGVLGSSLGELIAAAESDGCTYTEQPAPAEEPAEEQPKTDEPMAGGKSVAILQKKLSLKTKV